MIFVSHPDPTSRQDTPDIPQSAGSTRSARMTVVVKYPDSTKASLQHRLTDRARERWPQLERVVLRHRGTFSYIDGMLHDGTTLKLARLRYGGSAHLWGLAIYRASHDDYQPNYLPNGLTAGTPEEALDCACGLYLNDPTAW